MNFRILPGLFSVCRLGADASIPAWALGSRFFSVTGTGEELSVVCPQAQVPAEIKKEEGWKVLKIEGPLDFSLTGVLASVTMPLAREGIGILAISTYDTDYLLVKKENLERAIKVLEDEGHKFNKSLE